jgi:molybdopterin molybdotransferase
LSAGTNGLVTIEEALALVLDRVRPPAPELVPIDLAAGRVCAADVLAVVDLPPFASSAMDGYAVRAADTPGALRLTGRSSAGTPATREVGPGEAIAISTGGVVPVGADAVVPIEQTAAAGETVEVDAVAASDNVRPSGGDVRAGEIVVAAGTALGAAQIGAAAAAGVAAIACGPRPRVAVVPTGSELRKPGEPLEPGQIYESNGALLAALCRSAGAEVTQHGAVADDEGETRALLEAALEADVLVTSGGVSMGVKDLVRSSLAALGAEEVFWRVAVRPGKPVAFAVRGSTLVFGLPGNPVSSLVAFELFVRPALRALQGAEPGPFYLPGRLAGRLPRAEGRDDLARAVSRSDGESVWLEPLSGQSSHMIVRAAAGDALVRVPRGEGDLAYGAVVQYLRL